MTTLRQHFIAVAAFVLLSPIAAYAQTLTIAWDPNPSADQVTGYTVCIGTTSLSCNFAQASVSVNETEYDFTPNAGVRYFVAVRAVSAVGAGPYSQEVTVSTPSLSQPANQTSTVNQAISPLSLSASDPDGDTLRFSHTGLPFGLTLNTTTGVINGTPTSTGTYNVTVFVADDLVSTSRSFVWTVTSGTPGDTADPTVNITSHTAGQTVTTASITLAGTATDSGAGNSGITGVTVNGSAASGGTATGSGTANWSRSVSLSTGANTISVIATDGAGNTRSAEITITRSAASSDTTAPTVSITSHTAGQTVTTSSITLAGTATDSGVGNSGITGVTVNGSAASGGTATSSGTANWSRSVSLSMGSNTITVVAVDGNGNSRSSQITITRATVDTTQPGLSITSHTSGQTVTNASITLAGTATDNGSGNSGITSVTVNGQSASGGTASGSGTASWSRSMTLSSGASTITVIATDGAGNTRSVQVTVTYTPPVVTMTGASLSQNVASPQNTGTTIRFTASGSGGTSPYQYQWYVQPSGGTASMVRSWSTTTTYNWTPTQAGSYTISIWARSAGSSATTAEATAQRTFVIDAPAPSPSGVLVRDTFTGAGTPLTAHQPDASATGARWVQLEGATAWMESGRAGEVAANSGYGIATVNAGASDGSVSVDMLSNGGAPFAGLAFRVVDARRGLLLRYAGNWTTGQVGLFRRVNGAYELIQQVAVSPAIPGTTHRLGVQLSGTQVQALWDGVVVFTRTVTDYQTATQHGVLWHSDDPYAYFDNFTVTGSGTVSTPPSSPQPPPVNAPPVLSGPANQSHATGSTVSVQIVASDADSTSLQYGASGLPTGLSVNASTGVMSGTISASAGTYTVTTTASDGTTAATRSFTWTVTAAAPPPAPSPSGVLVRDTFTGTGTSLTAHQPDASATGARWVQLEGLPAWMENGRVGEVANSGYGIATVNAGASDGSVAVDVLSNGGAPYAGLAFRVVDANRGLLLRYAGNWTSGAVGLFRRVNGGYELIQQVAVPPAIPGTTHRLGVQLNGTQVQALWDGVVVFTRTVTDYQTATQHGVLWHSDDPYAYFDNFTVTAP